MAIRLVPQARLSLRTPNAHEEFMKMMEPIERGPLTIQGRVKRLIA